MQIVIYFGVAVSIFLLAWSVERAMQALERYYRIKDTREANAHLREQVRDLDKENRRLQSRLSIRDYQRSSALEHKLQLAQDEISTLRRELKVKESLLRAVDGKISAKAQEVTNG